MDLRAGIDAGAESPFVSTGRLPTPQVVQALVEEAHERYRTSAEGELSQVYPALARVRADLFGICVAEISGGIHAAGDTDVELTIMSVAKPFLYALVCDRLGREEVRQRIGVNATGLAFNSVAAVEQGDDGRTNRRNGGGSSATGCLASRGASSHSTRTRIARLARRTTATRASHACSRATGASTRTPPRRSICTRASAASR
jgi:glutaminase